MIKKSAVLICILCFMRVVDARPITVNIRYASLPDAIRFIAVSSGINVIVSPAVKGVVTIALNQVEADVALNSLLESQGLGKWKMGGIWYVAPKDELIKRREEEIKWVSTNEQAQALETAVINIKYAKAHDVAQMLKSQQVALITKRGNVQVDARTNTLLIQDVSESVSLVRHLIARIDIPVRQIMIEARLASIDTDFEREIGIDFTNALNGVAISRLGNNAHLNIKLSALERSGHAELISAPRLFTANQQAAYIESGEEVPYQEVSESGGTAVAFKKAVLGLQVTPQIMPDKRILLQLKINQDRPAARLVQGVPAINTRQMLTSVLVQAGETVVLGGIYETSAEEGRDGVPFLMNIPYIGALFRVQKLRHNKRELLIFVTPRII